MNIESDAMQQAAGAASALLKALSNPHRLLILCQLIGTERPVHDLARRLGLRDATVSQHLALLRRDRLVITRREGQTVWYAMSSAPAHALLEALHRVYCVPPAPAMRTSRQGTPARGGKTRRVARSKTPGARANVRATGRAGR